MTTDSDSRRVQRCRRLATAAGIVLLAYWIATIANVSPGVLNLAFTLVVIVIFPAGWLAVRNAPTHLRRFATLGVGALFFQIIANVLWYIEYLDRSSAHLPALGVWSAFLYLAFILGIGAAFVGVRDILHPRDAFLDYSIVIAAAASIGVAIIGHHFHGGWSITTADLILHPLLSLLIIVIIGSAALGRWQALPVPVGLVGISLLFDAVGFLWASYFQAEGAYTSDRWPNLMWFTCAVIVLLAALVIVAGIDRPIRLARKAVPGVSPLPLLATALVALALGAGVALHGALTHSRASLFAGLAAVAWIAVASLFRTTAALSETRSAYQDLEKAHFSLEQAREHAARVVAQRDEKIAQLAQRNVGLTAVETAFAPLMHMANERTNGQLRSNLEDAGDELAEWLLQGPEGSGAES